MLKTYVIKYNGEKMGKLKKIILLLMLCSPLIGCGKKGQPVFPPSSDNNPVYPGTYPSEE